MRRRETATRTTGLERSFRKAGAQSATLRKEREEGKKQGRRREEKREETARIPTPELRCSTAVVEEVMEGEEEKKRKSVERRREATRRGCC
jgi:hypothetical protein